MEIFSQRRLGNSNAARGRQSLEFPSQRYQHFQRLYLEPVGQIEGRRTGDGDHKAGTFDTFKIETLLSRKNVKDPNPKGRNYGR